MHSSDPADQFAAQHLGGRTMPNDLRKLLNLQWRNAASSGANPLNDRGVTFLDGNRLPVLIETVRTGQDTLKGIPRLADSQAMADMIRYCGFVAEDADGNAIGYWFGPDRIPIEAAPLICFAKNGNFSILRGNRIAEALLVIASHENDRVFADLRDYLNEQGLAITARTIHDVQQPECSQPPQATYQQLIQAYSADLSTTSAPDTGSPVNIMTTHRGPKIG